MMDRALRPALEKRTEKDLEFNQDVVAYRRRLNQSTPPKFITARRILKIIYNRLVTDSSCVQVVNVRNLSNIQYEKFGEDKLKAMYNEFLEKSAVCESYITDNGIRDLLITEMRKSESLKLDMHTKWDPLEAEDRTLEKLLAIFKAHLDFQMQQKQNQLELRTDGGKKAASNRQPRQPKAQEEPIAASKAGTKGKSKGKGAGKDSVCYTCGQKGQFCS